MAHGYTMVTGKPQAVMLHTNVGTANSINMLIDASRDRVPILLTSGRTPFTESGAEGSRSAHIHWAQEMFDQAGMLREVVKWDYEMKRGDQAGHGGRSRAGDGDVVAERTSLSQPAARGAGRGDGHAGGQQSRASRPAARAGAGVSRY